MTLLLVLLCLLVATPVISVARSAASTSPQRKQQPWMWRYEVWMPKHWQNLAWCESGTRYPDPPNWRMQAGLYEGAFAFARGTWDQYRYANYPERAWMATPFQQWRVARRVAARLTIGVPWGCWRGPQHAWVRAGKPERGQRT